MNNSALAPNRSDTALTLNGQPLAFESEANPYRAGGALVSMDVLRERLARGDVAAGGALPSEAELGAECGASRATVRRATHLDPGPDRHEPCRFSCPRLEVRLGSLDTTS